MSKHTPDGGWGWMIVAGCFLTTVCTRAVTRCVSIFFVEFQAYFSRDYSSTAWIHSLLDCTTMLCAPLGSYIGNRLSPRCAIMIGGFLSSSGLVLSSLASSLEFLYVTLGILTGVGFALSYTPAIAMVGSYFSERKALAYGIAMSGSGIGTFFLAPGVQLLIEIFSWKGALLILGGLVSHLCVCGAVMKPLKAKRRKPRDVEDVEKADLLHVEAMPRDKHVEGRIVEVKHVDADKMMKELEANNEDQNLEESRINPKRSGKQGGEVAAKTSAANPLDHPREGVACLLRKIALREYSFLFIPDFLLLLVSFLFLAYGCSVPFVYLVPYSLSRGVSSQQAALLMSILGVSGIVGTITFGWIADRKCLRQYRVASYMLAVGSEGLSCLCLPLLASFSLLVPFSLFYGYFDGAYVALIPVVTSDTVSSSHLSSALGIVYFLHAIPYLISPPIGGLLVDQTDSYTATFLLSGVSLICSAVILAAVRMILRCSRGRFDFG